MHCTYINRAFIILHLRLQLHESTINTHKKFLHIHSHKLNAKDANNIIKELKLKHYCIPFTVYNYNLLWVQYLYMIFTLRLYDIYVFIWFSVLIVVYCCTVYYERKLKKNADGLFLTQNM